MAKHRLDKGNDRVWGGPELTTMAGARTGGRRRHADRDTTEPMPPVTTGEPETSPEAAEQAS
jgi:hypothetical protein